MDPIGTEYDEDFYAWTQVQAALLRAEKVSDLDYANLAEEIESLGRSERQALQSRLRVLVMHLLKWRYQAAWQTPSWRPQGPDLLQVAYPRARLRAARQTHLPEATFPETCPWTFRQVMDEAFWPQGDEPAV